MKPTSGLDPDSFASEPQPMVKPTGIRGYEFGPSAVPGGGLGSFLSTARGHGLGAADAIVCPELSMLRAVSRGDDPEG